MTCERCKERPVSANKRWCMSCCEALASGIATAHREEPMDETTHILINFPPLKEFGDKPHCDLYRSDGMLVSTCHSDRVLFGNDIATAQSRLFQNSEMAVAFIKRVADVDLVCQRDGVPLSARLDNYKNVPVSAVIEERDVESSPIIIPGNRALIRAN